MLTTSCRTKGYGMHILAQTRLWSEREHACQSHHAPSASPRDQGNWYLIHRQIPLIFKRCCIHQNLHPCRHRLCRPPYLPHSFLSCAGRISDGRTIGVLNNTTSPRARVASTMKSEVSASGPFAASSGKKYSASQSGKSGETSIGQLGTRHMVLILDPWWSIN